MSRGKCESVKKSPVKSLEDTTLNHTAVGKMK